MVFVRLSTLIATLLLLTGCQDSPQPARAVGMTESERLELIAERAEPVVSRPLVEGDPVKAGALIIQLDPRRLEARLSEARAQLRQAQARNRELQQGPRSETLDAQKARVVGARKSLSFRLKELERAQSLARQELAPEEGVDIAAAAVDAARADLDVQTALLAELQAGTRQEQLDQGVASVQAAQARVQQLELELERLQVRAPVDGVIDSLPIELGEQPNPGQVVAVLLAGAQPYARVYIPEAMRASVRPGSEARVQLDGLPQALAGRVRFVASEASFTPYFALTEKDRGRLSYAAEVELATDGARLPDGVPVVVEFPGLGVP